MNDRLVTVLGALIAVAIVVGLFVQTPDRSSITKPTSVETGTNGYQAIMRWLEMHDVDTVSFRKRHQALDDLSPAAGNFMISTLPYSEPVDPGEVDALRRWIAEGNTLLILAALDDTPQWSLSGIDTESFLGDVEAISGTRFEALFDENDEPVLLGNSLSETKINLMERRPADHPLLAGVSSLMIVTDSVTSLWQPASGSQSPGIPILASTLR